MQKEIEKQINLIESQVIQWRRYLHKYPEISNEEIQTSQFIYETLQNVEGLEVIRPTETSVLGIIKGNRPGKILAIRADIDALHLHEEGEIDYHSVRDSAMHACGHDGHTAMLLGAASILARNREYINGTVKLVFQHAEEKYPGGAAEIIHTGVLDDVHMIIGAHLWTPIQSGKVGICPGPTMGGNNKFWITIKGRGGHAALPHQTIDPIVIGSMIVDHMQHIVSRQVNPFDQLVVSVTQFSAGTQINIIPDSAKISGTFRYLNPALSQEIAAKIEKIVNGVASTYDASYEIKFQFGYKPVVNDPELTSKVAQSIKLALGKDHLKYIQPIMASDDFSVYKNVGPICYFFIGAGNKNKGTTFPHHHPKFNIDESVLISGVKIFTQATFDLLNE